MNEPSYPTFSCDICGGEHTKIYSTEEKGWRCWKDLPRSRKIFFKSMDAQAERDRIKEQSQRIARIQSTFIPSKKRTQ